ncbi:ubiquinol-cytochrome c chaperone [Roseibium aquae]|uniref:Ubiquinol-cytochrome c chaperone n=1 Tax=Roseibium aquae TaxID=1323746 RepID=A0A916TLY7_9HYPH|nr:ubiquinol-cytochrome C chaperone family protein [Roseibium aquae]GGB56643.1 ubiquinol-cytochrome c chaperone [Roseibium aquae]
MLFGLFKRPPGKAAVSAYNEIVAQARQPAFYADLGVPDTIDGRFDILLIHSVLFFRRLRGEGKEVAKFSQEVFDYFVADMEGSLREMGISDTRVPKKVRAMGEAFYGRAEAYSTALDDQDRTSLAEAIGRNVFPETPNPVAQDQLADYMIEAGRMLSEVPAGDLMAAKMTWPDAKAFATG